MRLDEDRVREAMERATALEASQGQSAMNGQTGWQGLFHAVAGECDALWDALAAEAAARAKQIVLPPKVESLGAPRAYGWRASHVEGWGDMCALMAELGAVADDFWRASIALGIPRDRLPTRDRQSWAESWATLGPQNKWQLFLALFARGLLDLSAVIESWRSEPVEVASKQRRRA